MVKSLVFAEIEPGYEGNFFDYLKKEPELLEAHLTTYQNQAFIFLDSKDLKAAEVFVRNLRLMRMIRKAKHCFVVKEAKSGFSQLPNGKRLAFVFSNLQAGAEAATIRALAREKSTRDVLALTGPRDILVTAEVDGAYDLWPLNTELTHNVRFLEQSSTHLSKESIVKD